MDHLVTTGQISSVYAMPLSLYTLEDTWYTHYRVSPVILHVLKRKSSKLIVQVVVDPNYIRRPLTVVRDELSQKLMMHSNIYETLFYP